jgi:hypothetical protein
MVTKYLLFGSKLAESQAKVDNKDVVLQGYLNFQLSLSQLFEGTQQHRTFHSISTFGERIHLEGCNSDCSNRAACNSQAKVTRPSDHLLLYSSSTTEN